MAGTGSGSSASPPGGHCSVLTLLVRGSALKEIPEVCISLQSRSSIAAYMYF